MRLTPWQGIGLLVAALVLGVLAVAHAAAPPTCSDADQAFDGGRYTEAAKEYIAVIAEDPDSDCATPRLATSIRRLCRHANWLKRRRHPADAATAYTAIFKLEPGAGQARCKRGAKPTDPPKMVQGPPGPKGDPGKKGDTGDDGDKGDDGKKGDPGKKGDTGDDGDKGDDGKKGDPGKKGAKGDDGDKGDQGIQGIRGKQGVKGNDGDKGDQGIQGIRGKRGAKGDKGNKGDKGDPGPPGGGLLCCTG